MVDTCPFCGGSMELVPDREGTYECRQCTERTHEKIEAHREDLEVLAKTDLPISEIADLLLGDRR